MQISPTLVRLLSRALSQLTSLSSDATSAGFPPRRISPVRNDLDLLLIVLLSAWKQNGRARSHYRPIHTYIEI